MRPVSDVVGVVVDAVLNGGSRLRAGDIGESEERESVSGSFGLEVWIFLDE